MFFIFLSSVDWFHFFDWLRPFGLWLNIWKDALTIVGGTIAGVWALRVYTKAKHQERLTRLQTVFTGFYLNPDFRALRIELEFGYTERLRELVERVLLEQPQPFEPQERALLCDLDTCLNYFEFILYQESEAQLRSRDRDALFHYWYTWMKEENCAPLRVYLERFDYDRLTTELGHKKHSKRCGPGWKLLALYGTLLTAEGRRDAGLAEADLDDLGECTLEGNLHDLGEYPGIVSGSGQVKGRLFRVKDSQADEPGIVSGIRKVKRRLLRSKELKADPRQVSKIFAILDAHEGFVVGQADSLFVRRCVKLLDPPVDCWTYYYNQPVADRPAITGGDWLAHCRRQRSESMPLPSPAAPANH